MPDFNVGDKVTIEVGYNGAPSKILTITEVKKLAIKLSDGSRWKQNGQRWGETYSYGQARLRLAKDSDQERIERARYTHYLSQNGIWDKVPLPELREIVKRVNAIKVE